MKTLNMEDKAVPTKSARCEPVEDAPASLKYLMSIVGEINYFSLRTACYNVLADKEFQKAFGSAGKHHAYKGGLLSHTREVMGIALATASSFPLVDFDVLKTATIFHDYCKIHEYKVTENVIDDITIPVIEKTEYRNRVRHVAGSFAEFMKAIQHATDVSEERILNISHCLLSHHGRPEWGSVVEPSTLEAMILHYSDNLSSKFGPTKTNGR